jgi:hypothetical protein
MKMCSSFVQYLLTDNVKSRCECHCEPIFPRCALGSVAKQSPIKRRKTLRFGIFLSKRRLLRREKHPPRNDMPVLGLGVSSYIGWGTTTF